VRLSTRTGLAAFAAAFVVVLGLGAIVGWQFERTLTERVDAQLERRAESASILVAVADRLSRSELAATVEGARVEADGAIVELGLLPAQPLPDPELGWATAAADGERWRLHTVAVVDVPQIGDAAKVQLVAPLGDVDAALRRFRQRALLFGLLASVGAGLVAAMLGRIATRPLSVLRADASGLALRRPGDWRVEDRYGSPEVDEVAATLNASLERLADETLRRDRALEAARAFAASASHELRTPLQGALTNLDIAHTAAAEAAVRDEAIDQARVQLERMAASLAAVRALADAEFADPNWFEPTDLGDVVEAAIADEQRRAAGAQIEIVGGDGPPITAWRDGVQLAVTNIVRNAVVHGRHADRTPASITVTIGDDWVCVDDDGPGIPAADRARVLTRFERGRGSSGSGLGLAIAFEVAAAHGGSVELGDSPGGGARVVLHLTSLAGPGAPTS
jgi:two-component system sensor histidine kinase PrrB